VQGSRLPTQPVLPAQEVILRASPDIPDHKTVDPGLESMVRDTDESTTSRSDATGHDGRVDGGVRR